MHGTQITEQVVFSTYELYQQICNLFNFFLLKSIKKLVIVRINKLGFT